MDLPFSDEYSIPFFASWYEGSTEEVKDDEGARAYSQAISQIRNHMYWLHQTGQAYLTSETIEPQEFPKDSPNDLDPLKHNQLNTKTRSPGTHARRRSLPGARSGW